MCPPMWSSSRTSIMAMWDGGVEASRLAVEWASRISESALGERRGRAAIVMVDIAVLVDV